MTTVETYSRRTLPPAYDPSWFSVELGTVARVLTGVQGDVNAPTGVTAGTYGDATHVARITVNAAGDVTGASQVAITTGGPTTAMRTSDVSATSALVSAGLAFAVAIGESWTAQWVLFVGSSAGAAGGMLLSIAFPAVGHARSAANDVTLSAASPMSGGVLSAVDLSAADGTVTVNACFRGFTAAGTVDLKFKQGSGGETWIVRDSSALIATKI